jgi:hypothetical protein
MIAPLFDPAAFRIAPGIAHLCAAGETPFLRQHDAAFAAYAADKSDGPGGKAIRCWWTRMNIHRSWRL